VHFLLPFDKLLKCGALIGVFNLVFEGVRALAAAVPVGGSMAPLQFGGSEVSIFLECV
jgi:hypothetical protein